MNNTQRTLLATYLPFTFLILIFQKLYQDQPPALYLMFGVRLAMVFTVLFMSRKQKEHGSLILAFLCSLISDFFFVYLKARGWADPNRELYGMLGFIAAYLFFILAFNKNFSMKKREWLTVLPFAAIFLFVFSQLYTFAQGVMFPAAIVIGVVLCFTAMTMVATLYRGYFSKKAAWFIAVAGCIIFLSDMVVAYSIFYPPWKEFVLWKENVIWITYVPGWTLLMVFLSESKESR